MMNKKTQDLGNNDAVDRLISSVNRNYILITMVIVKYNKRKQRTREQYYTNK